jgi:hypothetical protein
MRSVNPSGGGFDDRGFGQQGRGDGYGPSEQDGFGSPDDWQNDRAGSQHFDGGQNQLEMAPSMEVEQERRNWALPVAGILALVALAAGYFFFIRDDGGDADQFAVEADSNGDLVEEDLEGDAATGDPATDAMGDQTDGAPAVLSETPVLTLQGADDGPLETEIQYEMQIQGVPATSQYLVIVDSIPQEPALDYLPLLILPEGRHSIAVEVRSGVDSATTNAVDVYVLAPQLTETYRANLSSVSMSGEGWSEAIRQFDEFRAAGHDGLVMSPSDPYPSLLPGFWNLYVGGFADGAEAQAYCEQAGLVIPDECFPAPFDPDGPPRDG